jgi:hypothetical protein
MNTLPSEPGRGFLIVAAMVTAMVFAAVRAEAAVVANVVGNTLVITGDDAENGILVSVVSGDPTRIEVKDNAILVGTFDRATFNAITVNAGGANDAIHMSPFSTFTEPGALFGGPGNDIITTGNTNDTVNGGDGDDIITWNHGQGSDIIDGGPGNDQLNFDGNDDAEVMTIVPNGARISLTRDVGNITMDIATVEQLVIEAFGGADSVTAADNLSANGMLKLWLYGGDGADTITGTDTGDLIMGGLHNDTLNGGGGNDRLIGGDGIDTVNGGDGNDDMNWNAGDDNDIFHGGDGIDDVNFIGSAANEVINVTAAAPRVLLTRDIDAVTLDIGSTELVDISGIGGNDIVNVGPDLTPPLTTVLVVFGDGNDVLNTVASSKVVANGWNGNDTLNFNALNLPLKTTATSITVGGVLVVDQVLFENVLYQNTQGGIPTLTIESPADASITAATPFISLSGTAADSEGVTSVTWESSRGLDGTATGTTSGTTNWSADIPVQSGNNTIIVTATDAQGNTGSDVLRVTVNAFTYTMAEGATGSFFDTDILIANPNTQQAPVEITYLKRDGTTEVRSHAVDAMSRITIEVDGVAGLENTEVSATVKSEYALPLIVERTMRWDDSTYGAHTEKATSGPALNWFFAEGAQGFFQTYVLLANPDATANSAEVRFLIEGEAAIVKTFQLEPTSRQTIFAGDIAELVDKSFGIQVTFQNPGVAERAMYFGFAPLFNAGHESAGVNSPAREWFLAEGATGSFFTTFVLLANPGASAATATVTFLPASGAPVTTTKEVPAGGRVTVNIAAEDASLASSAVATQVTATQPILVERAQYWPGDPAGWYEAHNSFGATSVGTRWGLAEGRVGGPEGYQTYILLANSGDTASEVRVQYLRTNGTTVVNTYTVEPKSRFNVHVNSMAPELVNEPFGALIEVLSGPGIFVERALYSDRNGVTFAAGTNALATRLPPVF